MYKLKIFYASLNVILYVRMLIHIKTKPCLKEMLAQDEPVHYELAKGTSYRNDCAMCLKIVHYYGF
jgi:hypothetical protein